MAEEFRPAKHGRELRDGLFFHGRRGASAIERMIVGIDGHRQGIRKLSYGVRRLQHLAGVQGMKIGIIVSQTFAVAVSTSTQPLRARHIILKFRQMSGNLCSTSAGRSREIQNARCSADTDLFLVFDL